MAGPELNPPPPDTPTGPDSRANPDAKAMVYQTAAQLWVYSEQTRLSAVSNYLLGNAFVFAAWATIYATTTGDAATLRHRLPVLVLLSIFGAAMSLYTAGVAHATNIYSRIYREELVSAERPIGWLGARAAQRIDERIREDETSTKWFGVWKCVFWAFRTRRVAVTLPLTFAALYTATLVVLLFAA